MPTLLAGAASHCIDPPLPADPQGFLRRAVAVRMHGAPLFVRACVVRSEPDELGGAPIDIAIVTADLTGLDTVYAHRIRTVIHETTGIAYDSILLNSSHSHASLWPRVDGKLHGEFDTVTDAEASYFARLPYDFATAVVKALQHLARARISGGVGRAPGLAVNRRERTPEGSTILGWNREGFIDEDVPTIRIDGHDGAPIATLVGFGCHPVSLGGEVQLSGPDFVGELRDRVELLRGGVCLFLQGAAGNILPLEAFCDAPGPEVAMGARLGLEAAHAVADADPRVIDIQPIKYGSVTPITLYRRVPASVQPPQPVAVRSVTVDLPLLPAMTVDAMSTELDQRRVERADHERAGAGRDVLNPISYHVNWLEAMLARAADGPLPDTVPGEVWAARLGDTAIVGTPGELFSELGAEVRSRSPFPTTIFAGYCQGVQGYVATAEEYAFGGYEPSVAQRGYAHPAPFTPDAGRLLVETAVELLESLAMNTGVDNSVADEVPA